MVPRQLVDLDFGIISISGASAAKKAVGVSYFVMNLFLLRSFEAGVGFNIFLYCNSMNDFFHLSTEIR